MTAIFDTHAHYDDDAFNEDREQLLAALPGQGIARVVDVGASLASCRKVLEMMELVLELVHGFGRYRDSNVGAGSGDASSGTGHTLDQAPIHLTCLGKEQGFLTFCQTFRMLNVHRCSRIILFDTLLDSIGNATCHAVTSSGSGSILHLIHCR